MISWIVATHDQQILERFLLPTVPAEDELVVVENASSIAAAYNEGTSRSSHRIKVYVHHDVVLADPTRLRQLLAEHCTGLNGIVGVIGSRTPVVPWWSGDMVGTVVDARTGFGHIGPGSDGNAAYLDGLLLATAQDLVWDEAYNGWHLYDHDICQQMLAAGLTNVCLPDGKDLVRHETSGPRRLGAIAGWSAAVDVFRGKWGEAVRYA